MSYILHTLNMIGQGPADGSLGEFILGGSDYGRTDTADIDRKVKARLVPAIKHPKTGEIYTGLRGEDHKDVMRKHGLGWKKLGLSFDSIEHTGYYDRATKKFYSHREAGFHSTDLMTPSQRFRKYGSESIEKHVLPNRLYHGVGGLGSKYTGKQWGKGTAYASSDLELASMYGQHGGVHAVVPKPGLRVASADSEHAKAISSAADPRLEASTRGVDVIHNNSSHWVNQVSPHEAIFFNPNHTSKEALTPEEKQHSDHIIGIVKGFKRR